MLQGQDKKEVEQCIERAQDNLIGRFPGANKVFQQFYTLKRHILIIIVIATFYILILALPSSLIFWGFLILTNLLIYVHIAPKHEGWKLATQRSAWFAMIAYSSVVILSNLALIFMFLPYMRQKNFVQAWIELVPGWVRDKPEIIGFISLE